jgi:hypothetical protein
MNESEKKGTFRIKAKDETWITSESLGYYHLVKRKSDNNRENIPIFSLATELCLGLTALCVITSELRTNCGGRSEYGPFRRD